jgi:hypothetical protein
VVGARCLTVYPALPRFETISTANVKHTTVFTILVFGRWTWCAHILSHTIAQQPARPPRRGHSTRQGRHERTGGGEPHATSEHPTITTARTQRGAEYPHTFSNGYKRSEVTFPTETDVSAMVCTGAHGVSATRMHDDPIRQRLHALQPCDALQPRAAALSNRASSGATAVGGPQCSRAKRSDVAGPAFELAPHQ